MNAVFCEANDDSATMKVHFARRKVLRALSASPKAELFGADATSQKVSSAKQSMGTIQLFSGMGHGGPKSFTGQGEKVVFDCDDTQRINSCCAGTVVHLYSCNCGKELGEHLVKKGAKAFVGYVDFVAVPSDQSVADEFVKIAASVDSSILNGDGAWTTKAKADVAFNLAEAAVQANPAATPTDLAKLRLNNKAMVGPWSDSKFGRF